MNVLFYDYQCNPNLPDTDFDKASDKEDATPLVTNEFINYIIHEKMEIGSWNGKLKIDLMPIF